jgi:cAMP phosphodiesterase
LLINDRIALDAGSQASALTPDQQAQVDTVLISHAHIDHIHTLPFFVENLLRVVEEPVRVLASPEAIRTMREHIFNWQVWPDFTLLPSPEAPTMRFEELFDENPVEVHGVRFTPIRTTHSVHTQGFLIEDGDAAVLWSSDTGPTTRLWEVANQCPNLRAAFIEVSFPNALQAIADSSLHLTPQTLVEEVEKLERTVSVLLHHVKPRLIDEVHREVRDLARPDFDFLEQGKTYEF